MARQGYEGASIADIAAAAGVAPGIVHYHFESKLDILLSLLDRIVVSFDARLARLLAHAGDDRLAQVHAVIDCHLALGKEQDSDVLACWIGATGEALRELRVRRRVEAALGPLVRRLAAIIAAGTRERVFRCPDADAAAAAIMATIQGYYVLSATARALIPSGSAAPAARRMAAGILRPRAE